MRRDYAKSTSHRTVRYGSMNSVCSQIPVTLLTKFFVMKQNVKSLSYLTILTKSQLNSELENQRMGVIIHVDSVSPVTWVREGSFGKRRTGPAVLACPIPVL